MLFSNDPTVHTRLFRVDELEWIDESIEDETGLSAPVHQEFQLVAAVRSVFVAKEILKFSSLQRNMICFLTGKISSTSSLRTDSDFSTVRR